MYGVVFDMKDFHSTFSEHWCVLLITNDQQITVATNLKNLYIKHSYYCEMFLPLCIKHVDLMQSVPFLIFDISAKSNMTHQKAELFVSVIACIKVKLS